MVSEEDIKILEKEIEWVKKEGFEVCGWEKVLPALENLLQGYKELKEENQSYRDYLGEPPCYDNASYIPKSLVEEKIEKTEKRMEGLITGDNTIYNIGKLDAYKELLGGNNNE